MYKLEDIDIRDLIPQRPPMLMIDNLTLFDEKKTTTKFEVRNDNIFCEDGKLFEAGIIEIIAQTCAARVGYINKILNNSEVRLGFIGAIKNLRIYFLPTLGDEIETTIEVVYEYHNVTLVYAKSVCNGMDCAECEMKISLT